jgi:hypothetical protein
LARPEPVEATSERGIFRDAASWRLCRYRHERRTFVTLARTDGARKDVLERITHGPRGDIVDLYTSLPWGLLCDEVSRLRIDLPGDAPKHVETRAAAGAFATGLATDGGKYQGGLGKVGRALQDSNLRPLAPEANALSS